MTEFSQSIIRDLDLLAQKVIKVRGFDDRWSDVFHYIDRARDAVREMAEEHRVRESKP